MQRLTKLQQLDTETTLLIAELAAQDDAHGLSDADRREFYRLLRLIKLVDRQRMAGRGAA